MENKKILIVDDEPELIEVVQTRLEANGYQVTSAQNGREGIEKAKSEKPHLVIMDIMMPEMDGYEACSVLKNDESTRKLPVILFTARAQKDDADVGQMGEADAYIAKPFDPAVLLAKIEELLNKSV